MCGTGLVYDSLRAPLSLPVCSYVTSHSSPPALWRGAYPPPPPRGHLREPHKRFFFPEGQIRRQLEDNWWRSGDDRRYFKAYRRSPMPTNGRLCGFEARRFLCFSCTAKEAPLPVLPLVVQKTGCC